MSAMSRSAAVARCAKCQRESSFVVVSTTIHSFQGPKTLCPRCTQRKRERDTYRTWGWAGAALLLIPAATASVIRDWLGQLLEARLPSR